MGRSSEVAPASVRARELTFEKGRKEKLGKVGGGGTNKKLKGGWSEEKGRGHFVTLDV